MYVANQINYDLTWLVGHRDIMCFYYLQYSKILSGLESQTVDRVSDRPMGTYRV